MTSARCTDGEARVFAPRRRTTLVGAACLVPIAVMQISPNLGACAAPTPRHLHQYRRILRGNDGRLRHSDDDTACRGTSRAIVDDCDTTLGRPNNSMESIFGNDFGSGAPAFRSGGGDRDISSSAASSTAQTGTTPGFRPSPSSVLTSPRGGAAAAPGYRTASQPIGKQPGVASSSQTHSTPSDVAALGIGPRPRKRLIPSSPANRARPSSPGCMPSSRRSWP
mmetsp:Transcript_7255/g.20142  ORF Transcript_7255/g.20142 Transcript_7255/m.20142 type:complete len:223 (+) Transcript_7255:1003-1671(+)